MKTVKLFKKDHFIANYTNVDRIEIDNKESILTLITNNEEVSIKQGVDIIMVYQQVGQVNMKAFEIIKRSAKPCLIDLFMNIKNSTENFNLENVKIFHYTDLGEGINLDKGISFYKEDGMKIDLMFTSREAYDSIYIALKK